MAFGLVLVGFTTLIDEHIRQGRRQTWQGFLNASIKEIVYHFKTRSTVTKRLTLNETE